MSQRRFIEIEGYRAYEWSEPQVEYTCDVCGREILPEQSQVHLYVRNGMHKKADGTVVQLEWFGLELHEDCISTSGTKLYQRVMGTVMPATENSDLADTQVFEGRHQKSEGPGWNSEIP